MYHVDIDMDGLISLAREAGNLALELTNDLEPEFKADASLVTRADREVELLIRNRLKSQYPSFSFLGEEFGRHGDDDAPLWAVDPIDGTTNLVFGIPFWGVSIGLIIKGEPAAGVFYMPRTEDMFHAVKGKGGFWNGKRLQVQDRSEFHPEDPIGFTSSALKNLPVGRLVGRLRCLGSIAGDIAHTATGALTGLIGFTEGAYDMAAALCVAYEAGCSSAYLTGEPFDLGEILRDGKTKKPFVIAPPSTLKLLSNIYAGASWPEVPVK